MPLDGLQISEKEASLGEIMRARSMNYWLEKISAEDIAKLWTELRESVRDVQPRILLDLWANGTMLNRDFRVVVTAPTTGDGFVVHFTFEGTSKSDGGSNANNS
jgi:hypothetical protein